MSTSRVSMFSQDVLKAGAGHVLSFGVEKELRNHSLASNGKPCAERFSDVLPEYKDPIFTTLATYMQVDVTGFERDIINPKPHQLGNTYAGGEAYMKHRSISDTEPS